MLLQSLTAIIRKMIHKYMAHKQYSVKFFKACMQQLFFSFSLVLGNLLKDKQQGNLIGWYYLGTPTGFLNCAR